MAAPFFLPICRFPLLRFGACVPRTIASAVLGLSLISPAYAQGRQSPSDSVAHSPSGRQKNEAIRTPKIRLNQELAALPEKLRRVRFGHWSILNHEIRPADSGSAPLHAMVLLDYNPPSFLKDHLSYRYRLHLEMQRDRWRLTTVEQQPYFKPRPPRLETYDYRPFRKMSTSRTEFKQFRSCFD